MARKQIKISNRMLLTWFVLASLIFLFTPHKVTNNLQFSFARLFHWPLSVSRNVTLSARNQRSLDERFSQKEILYQNHIMNLNEQISQAQNEAERLSGVRLRFGLEGAKLVPAGVTRSSHKLNGEFVINRGSNDYLAQGQFVLGDNSIIGVVCDIDSKAAKVRLFTHPASTIPVKIAGVPRMMDGNGNNTARIRMLPLKHDVKVGDVVFAAREPGFLDTAMIIGEVAQCKIDDDYLSCWDIIVKAVCDTEVLSEVVVIVMNPKK